MARPRIYESPEEMESRIDDYFFNLASSKEPATITGLILWLGFSHREALSDYEKRDGFSDIIKKAKLKVECEYEKKLSGQTVTGSIFALKNMGWKDKTEQEISGSLDTGGIDLSKLSDQALNELKNARKTT